MREYKICGFLIPFVIVLILLSFCPTVIGYAESSESSDGYGKGISLSTLVPPAVKSGSGAEYRKDSTEGLTFTTDDTANSFLRVLIDEAEIPQDSYAVSGEPLAITLHTDYLDALSAGEHKIKIVTANGDASADFTVTDSENQESTTNSGELPNTGVNGKNPLWIVTLVMCSGLLAIAFSKRTERRKDEK